MLATSFANALTNLVILFVVPFGCYLAYHKLRHKRSLAEVAQRAGLRVGERRYLRYCTTVAVAIVGALAIWPPSLEPMTREGSSWTPFVGLGLNGISVSMALLYGVVQTGFAEEFLFRGLICGSLSRRLPVVWANLVQALIFLAPHLLILQFMPEMWGILVAVFGLGLFVGWIRIASGSIVGPWLIHAAVNVAMGLSVAMRSAA